MVLSEENVIGSIVVDEETIQNVNSLEYLGAINITYGQLSIRRQIKNRIGHKVTIELDITSRKIQEFGNTEKPMSRLYVL